MSAGSESTIDATASFRHRDDGRYGDVDAAHVVVDKGERFPGDGRSFDDDGCHLATEMSLHDDADNDEGASRVLVTSEARVENVSSGDGVGTERSVHFQNTINRFIRPWTSNTLGHLASGRLDVGQLITPSAHVCNRWSHRVQHQLFRHCNLEMAYAVSSNFYNLIKFVYVKRSGK